MVINDHGFINGGQAKVAIDSAKGLQARGHRVIFFCASGPPDADLLASGVEVVCLNQPDILDEPSALRAMSRGIWNPRAAEALSALLAPLDPVSSVIHCHGFAKALSASIGPVITGSRIPHVYTMHEFFLACPNGGFYDFQKREICTRRALGASCLTTNCDARHAVHKAWRVVRQGVIWSAGKLPGRLRNVIYISQTQLRTMEPYLPREARLFSVPNPIMVEKRRRAPIETNDIFLFVGRLSPEKGGALFAEAARRANVRAVFIGSGPEEAAIRAINPDAEIVGWVAPHEVQAWLDRSRCLVFPSVWYETFGLVAYEAQARGVPVVCGVWNSAAESLADERCGVLYDRSDASTLAAALDRVASGEAPIDGQAIYDRYWSAPLSMDNHVDRLEAVYAMLED